VEFKEKKAEFKRVKSKAEADAPLEDPNDGSELPLKGILDELPDDEEQIDAMMDDAKTRINSIEDNPEVARQYEARQEEIASIEEELKKLNADGNVKQSELSKLEESWHRRLKKILEQVDKRFGKYMHDLGCAGSVTLYQGDEESGSLYVGKRAKRASQERSDEYYCYAQRAVIIALL